MEVHRVRRYRHLFFDLDHTLWDFEANSRAVLAELYTGSGLAEIGVDGAAFIRAYEEVNTALWARMEAGIVPREVVRALRFNQTLEKFGLRDAGLAGRMEADYMDRCPKCSKLLPGALDLLEDLGREYRMHIITNGFTQVQGDKMNASGIRGFFDVVLTSEMAGASKPSARIFRHAMRSAGAKLKESLMIGDNAVADIGGARKVGMDQAHLAPAGSGDPQATYRITRLDELRAVLL